jgi:hypothetical protein
MVIGAASHDAPQALAEMRIFNRVDIIWFVFLCLAIVAACLLYVSTFHPQRLPVGARFPQLSGDTPGYVNVGGTPLGLIFGSISFGIFIFAGLLGLRKKIPLWRVGTVQRWLRAHIWLTLLTIPLVILHTGFRLGGPMTTLLVTLYVIVMVSGIYGLTLQHYLPRLMNERLSTETVSEQIPFIRAQLCEAAEMTRARFAPIEAAKTTAPATRSLIPAGDPKSTPAALVTSAAGQAVSAPANRTTHFASTAGTATAAKAVEVAPLESGDSASETILVDFIDRQVLPYLRAGDGKRRRLGNPRYSDDIFRMLKLRVAAEYGPHIEEIQAWCDQRRMLDVQTRLQHWLHGWLFIHVPLSYLLIFMTAWHAFVTLFRY